MKVAAIIVNAFLFIFICFVLATDGLPTEASYIVFTAWSLLTLIFSTVVISRMKKDRSSISAIFHILAIACNIVFLMFTCWAAVDQYPHPKEAGVIEFAIFMVMTPILNLVALFCSGARNVLRSLHS